MTLVIHLIICWLFVNKFGWKEVGAAIATDITYILNMILIDIVCWRSEKYKDTWCLPDTRVFENIGYFVWVGIPGACMLCFEWWCFELLAIFSGLMSVEALAAEVIIVNIVTLIFMIPLGISISASSLTGVFVGLGFIDQAKRFARLTLVFDMIITAIVIIILKTA